MNMKKFWDLENELQQVFQRKFLYNSTLHYTNILSLQTCWKKVKEYKAPSYIWAAAAR